MEHDEIRPNMKVSINQDISRSKSMWGNSGEMSYMAGSVHAYTVDQVKELVPRHGVGRIFAVEVNGCWFAPDDLRPYEPAGPEEVELKNSAKIKFDPATL